MNKTIGEWTKLVHELSASKGWWPIHISTKDIDWSRVSIPEKLALIHSEISEALEFYRTTKSTYELIPVHTVKWHVDDVGNATKSKSLSGFPIELADTVIRIMDLCAALGIDLEEAIIAKHEYNKTRPYKHGGKSC